MTLEAWQDLWTAIVLALATYAATNVDNFLLLSGLAATTGRLRPIVIGFAAASSVVLLLAISFSLLTYLIPVASLRYLGLVPIAIGLRLLIGLGAEDEVRIAAGVSAVAVAMILITNSFDTVATFGPLFAESETMVRGALAAGYGFAAVVTIWGAFRFSGSANRALGSSKLLSLLTPVIMIAVGCYIFFDTGTDLE